MKNCLLLLHLLFFSMALSFANTNSEYEIIFKSEKFTPEVTTDFGEATIPQSTEENQEYIYRLIQFYDIPNTAKKQLIKNAGIELLSYIPNKAFIAKIQKDVAAFHFDSLNIRSLFIIEDRFKLSPELTKTELPEWAITGNDILLNVEYYSKTDKESIIESITNKNGKVTYQLEAINLLTIQYSIDGINDLAKNPLIKWIEPISSPGTSDGTDSKNTFRSNTLNTSYSAGRKYDGSGIVVALSDVGMIGPHIDTKGRVTQHTDIEDGNHSDMTSGIFIGAGNLDPTKGGVASGADIHIYKHIPNRTIESHQHIVNAVENLETYGTVVTSTSYSQGEGGTYDVSAEFGDKQLYENQNIIHILSAGNSGSRDHGYGAGAGWGNVTGGYKAGKNVICVGNVSGSDVLKSSSGRGPAADGRIKPDICAQGDGTWTTNKSNTYQVGGGTSAAAPGVAGVVTQLYQAYKENNSGAEPETGLLKASLLNTAKDLGNPGPDYKYGWGRINALKAVRVIEDKRYIRNSIEQGENRSHNITVPNNVSEVRFMVYWTDVEGSSSSGIGLVNDIDMEVVTSSNITHNPWVLDPTPNATNLDADAVEGIDRLNNVEQVTIKNPQTGNYTVNLSGFAIPEGPQTYYVLYEFIYEGVELTYPIGGEGFVPGESEWIRWDASTGSGNFELEYSVNGGDSYTSISNNISSSAAGYKWTVPNRLSNNVKLRVSRGSASSESHETLTIVDVPENIEILKICPESIKIGWDPIDDVSAYEISVLGEKYMDSVGVSNTNTFEIRGLDPDEEHWFSVRALVSGGKGRRAIAVKKDSGTPIDNDCALGLTVDIEIDGEKCLGDSILLSVKENQSWAEPISYQWFKNGNLISEATNSSYYVLEAGDYYLEVTANEVSGVSSATSLSFLETPLPPSVSDEKICKPGIVTLTATGTGDGILKWYADEEGTNELAEGNTFSVDVTETSTYYVKENSSSLVSKIGMEDNSGIDGRYYGGGPYLIIDVESAFVLKSVKVYAEEAGDRTFEVRDANEELLLSKTVYVESGESRVELDFNIPVGNDLKIGIEEDGLELYRSKGGIAYPFVEEGIVTIKSSTLGSGYYYFLYDWEIQVGGKSLCSSPSSPVTVLLDNCVGLSTYDSENLTLFPNPTSGLIHLKLPDNFELKTVEITGIQGNSLLTHHKYVEQIDLQNFKAGTYLVKVTGEYGIKVFKIEVQ